MTSSLERDREAFLRTLAQVYATENRRLEVEILAKAKSHLEQTDFDNWNGGTYTYALNLHVSPVLYAKIGDRLKDIEQDMFRRLEPLLRSYSNEHLGEVIIATALEHDENWKQNALRWLAEGGDVSPEGSTSNHDAFISHAVEDKRSLVGLLANELTKRGLNIWYDDFELTVGDSLRQSIDKGLRDSRFGIVVFSAAFFAKKWPQYELDGLLAKQSVGQKVILPIWHGVTREDVLAYSPALADTLALDSTDKSVSALADELARVLRRKE